MHSWLHFQNQYPITTYKTPIVSGIYKNEASALNDIVIEFIKNKLNGYKTTIEKFELKYKTGLKSTLKNFRKYKSERACAKTFQVETGRGVGVLKG